MSTNTSNHLVNPAAREAMDKFKMEAASEVGVNLKNGYNGETHQPPGRFRRRPDGQEDDRGLRERHEVNSCPGSAEQSNGLLRIFCGIEEICAVERAGNECFIDRPGLKDVS